MEKRHANFLSQLRSQATFSSLQVLRRKPAQWQWPYQKSAHGLLCDRLRNAMWERTLRKHNSTALRHASGGPNGAWTPFGYYNRREFDHLPIVFQRRLIAVDQEECLLCPGFLPSRCQLCQTP